jgi:O-antigen ligase
VFAYLLNGSIPLPSTVARFRSHGSAGILSDRQLAWDFGIRLWELRPWTGYGFRTGELLFVENRGIAHGSTIGAALNSYLQILIELGYIGIFPLAGMILALIWGLAHLRFLGMRAGLAALVVSGLASGVTESALFGLGSVICWVFWFAATALTVTAHKNSKITSPPPLRQVPRNTGAFQ